MSVTYYLGAGASAKKIPCVADLSEKIRKIVNFIRENWTQGDISYYFNGNTIKTDGKADYKRESSTQIIEEFCTELDGQLSIDILSWNYDLQLERAFKEIFPSTNNIWDEHAEKGGKSIFKHTGVNFKKLNGSASMPDNF